jgi:hypothetical protein
MIRDLRSTLEKTSAPLQSKRSIWLLAFLMAVIAYVALLTRYESQIADVETQIADINGIVSSDALFARARPRLIKRSDLLVGQLRDLLTKDANEADAMGRFLRDAHGIAQRNGVTITSVGQDSQQTVATPAPVATAAARPAVPIPKARAAALLAAQRARGGLPLGPVATVGMKNTQLFDNTFVPIPIHLEIVGPYESLLRTLVQLSDSAVLVRVDRIALSPGSGIHSNLDADVSVVVYRPAASAAVLTRGVL